jgi:hypothetical protein
MPVPGIDEIFERSSQDFANSLIAWRAGEARRTTGRGEGNCRAVTNGGKLPPCENPPWPGHHRLRDALTIVPGPAIVACMDTMKLLLGATVALLLGALVMSWQGMNYGVKNAPPDELARLKKQVTELRQEQDKLQLEKEIQRLKATAPPPAPTPAANAAEIEAMKAQVEASKAALAQIEADKEKAKRDAKVNQDEEGLLDQRGIEKADDELRRARMIGEALLIGRVKEYVEDAQAGGFITFDILMPEQVQSGTILAIRRKTGILGKLKVSEVTAEGGVADPLPGFGPVQPKVGDELILPPQY